MESYITFGRLYKMKCLRYAKRKHPSNVSLED